MGGAETGDANRAGGGPCALNSKSGPTLRSSSPSSRRFFALVLTLISGAIMFALRGKDPLDALYVYLHRAAARGLVAA